MSRVRADIPPEFIKPSPPATFTAAALMDEDLPPVNWVVRDILPEGVTLLVGKPKLGKSWLALGLGVATASGGAAFGTTLVEQGDALYLALEDNPRRLQKRLKKLLAGERAPARLYIATNWARLNEGGDIALKEWLQDHPEARLIVIDTLAKVRPHTNGQHVYQEDYGALEALLPLAAEHGVGIVVVHHLRKMGAADPLDEISGSTGLSAGVDGALVLKRDRGKADAVIHVDGRDIEEPAELALRWNADTAGWTIVGDAEEFRLSEERRAILAVLEESESPMTPAEMADVLGKNRNTLKQRLWRMAQDGQLINRNGAYEITHNPDNRVTEESTNGYGVMPVMGYSEGSTEADTEDEEMRRTGIIQSERQVFDMAREHFGINDKEARHA